MRIATYILLTLILPSISYDEW